MGNSNQQYKEIGNRINTLLSPQDEGLTNIDIYNKIFGDDKKSDSAKKNKISDLRAGRKISIDDLMLISSFFDVSLDWLVYGKKNDSKPLEEKPTSELIQAIIKRIMDFDEKKNIEEFEGFKCLTPDHCAMPRKFTSSRIEKIEKYFHTALMIYNTLASNGVSSSVISNTMIEMIPVEILFYFRDSQPWYISQDENRRLSGKV